MTPRLRATLRSLGGPIWRDERGEIVSAVVLGAKGVVLVLAALLPFIAVIDEARVSQCIDIVTKASESLSQRFPGAASAIPQDDIDVQRIQSCKNFARQLAAQTNNSAAAKNLTNLADASLQNLGQCTLNHVDPAAPEAGLTGAIYVNATIPFAGPTTNVTATVTLRGGQFSASLDRGPYVSVGQVGIPANQSANAAGEVSTVVVTATSVVPGSSAGTCIPPSTAQGGQCVVSCTTPTQNVVWKDPPGPEIKLFLAAPLTIDAANPVPVVLAWNVANATQVTIDQGVGEVAHQGSSFELPPDQDTTYTLTAIGARPQDTRTATQTVKVTNSTPFTVSITSPGGSSQTTATSVAVTGTVTPAPGKTLNGTITVNGGSAVPVTVDPAGNFAGSVSLARVTTAADLSLANPDLGVTACGDRSVPVTLRNLRTASDATNTIAVTVTDGPRQASAAVTVLHAVQINSFVVNWLSCPPLNKNQALSTVLGAGQTVTVGTVDCGCNGSPSGCHASCSVSASVGTSVGTIQDSATWTFNVAGPCP
jgi:hypothetical protein